MSVKLAGCVIGLIGIICHAMNAVDGSPFMSRPKWYAVDTQFNHVRSEDLIKYKYDIEPRTDIDTARSAHLLYVSDMERDYITEDTTPEEDYITEDTTGESPQQNTNEVVYEYDFDIGPVVVTGNTTPQPTEQNDYDDNFEADQMTGYTTTERTQANMSEDEFDGTTSKSIEQQIYSNDDYESNVALKILLDWFRYFPIFGDYKEPKITALIVGDLLMLKYEGNTIFELITFTQHERDLIIQELKKRNMPLVIEQ